MKYIHSPAIVSPHAVVEPNGYCTDVVIGVFKRVCCVQVLCVTCDKKKQVQLLKGTVKQVNLTKRHAFVHANVVKCPRGRAISSVFLFDVEILCPLHFLVFNWDLRNLCDVENNVGHINSQLVTAKLRGERLTTR